MRTLTTRLMITTRSRDFGRRFASSGVRSRRRALRPRRGPRESPKRSRDTFAERRHALRERRTDRSFPIPLRPERGFHRGAVTVVPGRVRLSSVVGFVVGDAELSSSSSFGCIPCARASRAKRRLRHPRSIVPAYHPPHAVRERLEVHLTSEPEMIHDPRHGGRALSLRLPRDFRESRATLRLKIRLFPAKLRHLVFQTVELQLPLIRLDAKSRALPCGSVSGVCTWDRWGRGLRRRFSRRPR